MADLAAYETIPLLSLQAQPVGAVGQPMPEGPLVGTPGAQTPLGVLPEPVTVQPSGGAATPPVDGTSDAASGDVVLGPVTPKPVQP